MSLVGAKNRAGLPANSLEELLAGKASVPLSQGVGAAHNLVQDFLDGDVKPGMASALYLPLAQAQELRDRLGPEGARGFLLGLLWGREE